MLRQMLQPHRWLAVDLGTDLGLAGPGGHGIGFRPVRAERGCGRERKTGWGADAGPAWPGDGAAETAAGGLGTGSLRFACFYLTSTGAGSPWRLP